MTIAFGLPIHHNTTLSYRSQGFPLRPVVAHKTLLGSASSELFTTKTLNSQIHLHSVENCAFFAMFDKIARIYRIHSINTDMFNLLGRKSGSERAGSSVVSRRNFIYQRASRYSCKARQNSLLPHRGSWKK